MFVFRFEKMLSDYCVLFNKFKANSNSAKNASFCVDIFLIVLHQSGSPCLLDEGNEYKKVMKYTEGIHRLFIIIGVSFETF